MNNCLITGATSGIGRAAAIQLADRGVRLLLTGRNVQAGSGLIKTLAKRHREFSGDFIPTDLSELQEVHTLAREVRERIDHLDLLVLNAGARFDAYGETSAGIERTFATNHLGHFLLTGVLVELLLAAPSARVVVTGSSAHAGAPSVGVWCLSAKDWDRKTAYAKSKLANIMFAYELARRTAGTTITCNAFDPGGVATRLGLNNGLKAWMKHLLYYALKRQLLSARKGADTLVYLATDESVRGQTGRYYHQRREVRSSPASYDQAKAEELWRLSVKMSGLDGSLDGLSEQARTIMLG